MSPDPDPAAGNPFAYAADDPLDLTDPTGHCIFCVSALKSVAHAVVSAPSKAKTVLKAAVKVAAKVTAPVRAAVAHAVTNVKAVGRTRSGW